MEIVNNGICLQEKEISDRCAVCRNKLVMCVYKFQWGFSDKIYHKNYHKKMNPSAPIINTTHAMTMPSSYYEIY